MNSAVAITSIRKNNMKKKQLLTDLTDEQCEKVVGGHNAGPCNGTGSDYAAHHIVPLATMGGLGNGGHKPGSHQGFSICH